MPDSNMKPEEAEKLRPQWKKAAIPFGRSQKTPFPMEQPPCSLSVHVSYLFRYSYLNCYFRLLKNGFIIHYLTWYIKY